MPSAIKLTEERANNTFGFLSDINLTHCNCGVNFIGYVNKQLFNALKARELCLIE